LATNLASVLARLHELDLDGLDRTPVPPMVSRGDILARVDEQEQGLAVAAPTSRSPYATLCALLLAWLRCHAPDGPERPSLCHGDVGFHNMLASGGDVVGLVDWERAVLGDPAQDLAYVRPQVEQVVPWQAFLDDYGAAGGHPPKADVLEYYSVWHDVWRAIGCLRRRARFERSPTRVSDAVAALLHGPRFTSGAVHTALGVQP
jgi:aminoglycoside phosphotransferase (APT) family kinase protein